MTANQNAKIATKPSTTSTSAALVHRLAQARATLPRSRSEVRPVAVVEVGGGIGRHDYWWSV
ncbi:hypothetical protein NHF48_011560 [Sphingomonas sp. H160509]|uniref:hypothetical protein n=1 Tax=Sphingomonas sp. H160509 TaxID=2955313 RepID=UPI00209713E9|nr:hypothetical protein [Sphingomonas sp. H160509]MDD1451465.1 hypothetical protein [Sphingomonas sp. H160509]